METKNNSTAQIQEFVLNQVNETHNDEVQVQTNSRKDIHIQEIDEVPAQEIKTPNQPITSNLNSLSNTELRESKVDQEDGKS